jgi:hypothetical protein
VTEHAPPGPLTQPARPTLGKTWFWLILGLAFAALVVLALYRAWPSLYPEVVATAPLDPSCDLRSGPCTAQLPDGGRVSFGLEPRTIRPMTPLHIVVDLDGLEAHAAEVDFAGTDMNMGYNRATLERTATGRFEGQATLPACVRHRMGWEAKVLLHTDAGILAAPFRFETVSAEPSTQ